MYGITPTIPEEIDIKQYHALFTQVGTNTPDVVVLHNTTKETPTWSRTNLGVYTLTGYGIYTAGKTIIEPWGGSDGTLRMAYTKVGTGSQPQVFVRINRVSTTDILIRCYSSTANHTLKEFSDVGGEILIKISIYK